MCNVDICEQNISKSTPHSKQMIAMRRITVIIHVFRGSPPVSAVVTSFKDLMLDDEKSGAKPKQTTAHNTSPVSSRGDFTTIR